MSAAHVEQLAYRPEDAARALSVSRDYFDEHIAPELRWIRRGRLKLVSADELRRWLRQSSEPVLPERSCS